MGKHPDPSAEEIEFIDRAILRGLDDVEILEEIQDTEFPLRSIRFLRQRRMQFDVAKRVLQTNPAISTQWQNHFAKLTKVANDLLAGNLSNLIEIYTEDESSLEQTIMSGLEPSETLSNTELRGRLRENLDMTCQINGYPFVIDNFPYHLWPELPDVESLALDQLIEQFPSQVINALRLLADRGTFKLRCPICKDW